MQSPNILVVEDDQFYGTIFQKKLSLAGYDVVLASDGAQGIAKAKEKRPDLILLDLIMPVMDGFETLKELRKDDTLKDIKVIVLSNLGQEADVEAARQYGITDFIVKSNLSVEEMLQVVQKALH